MSAENRLTVPLALTPVSTTRLATFRLQAEDGRAGGRFELAAVGEDVLVDLRAPQADRAAREEAGRQVLRFVGRRRSIGADAQAAADDGAVEAEGIAVGIEEVAVVAIDVAADDGVDEPHFAFGVKAVAQVDLAADVRRDRR